MTPKVILSSLGQLYNWAWGHQEDMERDNEAIELQFVSNSNCWWSMTARRGAPLKEFEVHGLETCFSEIVSLDPFFKPQNNEHQKD